MTAVFDQYTKTTVLGTFPLIPRYIYSKHRRLQLLKKNEQSASGNTPVVWDPNQVNFLYRPEVTPEERKLSGLRTYSDHIL